MISFSGVVYSEPEPYPEDVRNFIEVRDGCDHFRGEPPYDEERRQFLLKNIEELCTGTDQTLSKLKNKYKENQKISIKLSEYEENIEIGNNL